MAKADSISSPRNRSLGSSLVLVELGKEAVNIFLLHVVGSRQAQLMRIAAANAKLNGLLDLLPQPQTSRSDASVVNSRVAFAELFELAQQQDSLVAALVVGTQSTDTVAVAADKFRAGHGAIARLARGLMP